MSERGELNVGQLVRERFGEKALLIGFSTYSGTVTAARDWGDPAIQPSGAASAQGCAIGTRSFSTRREFRVSG